MPVGKDSGTVDVTVTFQVASASRGIRLVVTPVDEAETLAVARSSVVVSLWREGATVVRGTVTHVGSGAVAYFQGTGALMQIAETLDLRVENVF